MYDDSKKLVHWALIKRLIIDLVAPERRFIECCASFDVNELQVKLATAFVILRLMRIRDEESWSKYGRDKRSYVANKIRHL